MIFDKENLADDQRNDVLSRMSQDNEELRVKNFNLVNAVEKIKEVWIASEGMKIESYNEAYLERLCREMYMLASEAVNKNQ